MAYWGSERRRFSLLRPDQNFWQFLLRASRFNSISANPARGQEPRLELQNRGMEEMSAPENLEVQQIINKFEYRYKGLNVPLMKVLQASVKKEDPAKHIEGYIDHLHHEASLAAQGKKGFPPGCNHDDIMVVASELRNLIIEIRKASYQTMPMIELLNGVEPVKTYFRHDLGSILHPDYWGAIHWIGEYRPESANKLEQRLGCLYIIAVLEQCLQYGAQTELTDKSFAEMALLVECARVQQIDDFLQAG